MKIEKKPSTALVPCPVVLLSVRGPKGPNIITLSWAANVCSKPPTVVVGIRPERYSHHLVKDAGEFVLNVPSTDLHEASVFSGTKSGKDYDKFHECKLTAREASKVKAPLIEECPISLECKTTQVVNAGSHDLFVAEVLAIHIEESVLDENGRFNAAKASLFTYLPLGGEYWTLGTKID
ncbi:flavin reductase family protein [Candidatus Thorarchaeota archaeon]|nr:MAG: flavin reductase family protein [Candidatus Thorarchaeota archaeon]